MGPDFVVHLVGSLVPLELGGRDLSRCGVIFAAPWTFVSNWFSDVCRSSLPVEENWLCRV